MIANQSATFAEQAVLLDRETPSHRPSPAMIADALRRNAAPRPIVAWLMGDPPPGQSALDKRNAAPRRPDAGLEA
jgi:hypothetical protein